MWNLLLCIQGVSLFFFPALLLLLSGHLFFSSPLSLTCKSLQGEAQKVPKAFLHQLCQRSGWEAPKFNKVTGEGRKISYTVSILRKASGRGKSRQAGGLVTLQLPDQDENYESIEVLV